MKIISKPRIFSERIYENIDTFKKFRNNLVYTETEDEDEYFRKGFQESVRQVERTWTETEEMDFIRAD